MGENSYFRTRGEKKKRTVLRTRAQGSNEARPSQLSGGLGKRKGKSKGETSFNERKDEGKRNLNKLKRKTKGGLRRRKKGDPLPWWRERTMPRETYSSRAREGGCFWEGWGVKRKGVQNSEHCWKQDPGAKEIGGEKKPPTVKNWDFSVTSREPFQRLPERTLTGTWAQKFPEELINKPMEGDRGVRGGKGTHKGNLE